MSAGLGEYSRRGDLGARKRPAALTRLRNHVCQNRRGLGLISLPKDRGQGRSRLHVLHGLEAWLLRGGHLGGATVHRNCETGPIGWFR